MSMIVTDIEIAFEYGDDDETIRREIARNVQMLLSTPIGTCPLYRHFGLDVTYVDYPMDIARNLYTVAVMEAVERWEPRARVTGVTFDMKDDGSMKAKVVLGIGQSAQIGL